MHKLKLLLVACALVGYMFTFVGCGSTPEATATNVAATQVTTVDAAMQAWAAWVKAGHATQAQVDQVKALYDKYYAVAQLEKTTLLAYVSTKTDVTQSAWQASQAALAASESDLVNLIATFKGK